MDGPAGELELVAFEEEDSLQIGVARRGGELLASIPAHWSWMDYEPYAWRTSGWAVAFGAVPPTATHAEVRNEDGEVFPARIVSLPRELGSEDQAAWGAIDRFEVECLLVSFDATGRHLTTIGEFAIAPRAMIGEGDDPIGGHWRLWISRTELGPWLMLHHAWGAGGGGIGKLPGFGFGSGSLGSHRLPGPRTWAAKGLVTPEADRVEVTTAVGTKPAVLLTIPRRELGPCKAYVAFMSQEEEPRSLTAFDDEGEVLATFDYEGFGSVDGWTPDDDEGAVG